MKIAFISSAENIHTIRWVNGLANKGLDVYLISLKNHDNKYSLNELNKNVKVIYLPVSGFKGYYLNIFFINKIINKIKPDIVNVHYASGYGTLGRFIKFNKKLLNVCGSDIYDFPNESKIKKNILVKNLNAFKYIASTSYCMAEETKKYLYNKESEIYITPFGVDLEKFKKIEKNKQDDEFVVGIVKALKEKYGIEYLIKAIGYLKNDLKVLLNLKLKIYGDGPLENELKILVKKLNIESIVEFKGRINNEEVPKVINEMDIFVVPSILDSESFGVAAVEAMACEVPVIVSNVGGLKEVVEDKKTGYIVEKKDYKVLAEKIEKILLNEELKKLMGKTGRKRVLELYNWDENVQRMILLYRMILEKEINENI